MDYKETENTNSAKSISRVRWWYAALVVVFGAFAVRLFYLQIIKHDDYIREARSDQIREYEVDADRGAIYAKSGDKTVPLVVNQKLYTIYADPSIIKDVNKKAKVIADILGSDAGEIAELLNLKDRRYAILKKRVSAEIRDKIIALKYAGVGAQERNYRTYPQGSLASQLLGFVNDDGVGKYGVEQALNGLLSGKKGQLKAVTDVNGVPLAANAENMLVEPEAGDDIVLTVDVGIQAQVERIVKKAQETYKSTRVSAVVLETNSGAVKAMANYPTYNPAEYDKVEDGSLFRNAVVSEPIEPGSITKVLSIAAGLDTNAIEPDTTYSDPGKWTFDGAKILNITEGKGAGQQNIASILNQSLNTGAVWVLMQMGAKGGTKITAEGRQKLYDYYHDHYRIDQETGIEQGYELPGTLISPEDKDNGIAITYANMAFGQAYTASALQMGAALNAIVNGGNYYQPHLLAERISASGETQVNKAKILKKDVVSDQTSKDMIGLLEYVTKGHVAGWPFMKFDDKYSVGGKTGTAQIPNAGGGYREDLYNGTFMGFVGGDKPQYTIVVYNYEPKEYKGHAGSQAAQPVFAEIAHMLIDNYGVTPRK